MGLLGRPPRGGAPGGLGTSGGAPDGGTGFRAGFVVGPPMTRRSTLALVSSPKSTPSPFASSESVAAIDLSFPTRPFTEGWSNIRSTLTMCSARSFSPSHTSLSLSPYAVSSSTSGAGASTLLPRSASSSRHVCRYSTSSNSAALSSASSSLSGTATLSTSNALILPPNCSTAATGLPSADPLEPPDPADAPVPGLEMEELAGLDGGVLGVPALIAAASATPVT
mmetsp:Transcript_1473/g.6061  ORF Transcript_1473/g.6061 Transcript_1473/m.6061 type:complete len:224 (-) Transcript_1473:557-1228(-)